jgi:hypothetical protein
MGEQAIGRLPNPYDHEGLCIPFSTPYWDLLFDVVAGFDACSFTPNCIGGNVLLINDTTDILYEED